MEGDDILDDKEHCSDHSFDHCHPQSILFGPASESWQSRGGTEADPVGHVTRTGDFHARYRRSRLRRRRVRRLCRYFIPRSSPPRQCSRSCRSRTKSFIGSKSRKRKAVGVHVALSAADGAQDRPQFSRVSWRRFPDLPRKRGVTGNVKQDPRALSRIHSNGTGRCEFCSFQHRPSVSIAYILNLSRVATTSARKAARQVALSTGASGAFLIVVTPSLFKHHNCDDNKDSTHSSDGDGDGAEDGEGEVVVADVVVADVDRDADGETRGEDEEETPQTISSTQAKAPSSAPDRHSLRAASESGQSGGGGGTEG